ncbi:MAG: ThuA domain-containing protein, partial [Phycisphaeraceae bacterium]|nr:ThuA domain-containing protein [Phycisphaeraceae bacterium]
VLVCAAAGLSWMPQAGRSQTQVAAAEAKSKAPAPLRALMVCGGCCHDYAKQKVILSEEISKRARVVWTIVQESKSKNHKNSAYDKADWYKGYDVVFHNECYGAVKDEAFIEKIVAAHRDHKVPAVFTHCSAHSYRAAKNADQWRSILGVTSTNHGPKFKITVKNLKPKHPVMAGFGDTWLTPNGELYNIKKVWPTATPLAAGSRGGKGRSQVCIWVNEVDGYRAFATTLGHHNETMKDPKYLDTVARGLLWACGKLNEDGTPKSGYGPQK